MSGTKIIVVIGATGAQGFPIIQGLLKPSSDGTPSPYRIRALTRDPDHRRAKELEALGSVELVKGSFMDFKIVAKALEGAYGAFVNTDGFTVGEQAETFAGIKIFELAKIARVRHFVYSNLDYGLKKGGYNSKYQSDHLEGKARVAEFIKAQPNQIDDPNGTIWSIITTGAYMEMLHVLFAPIKQRPDGTFVFPSPLGDGHVPLIALQDFSFWTRLVFDKPSTETTGKDLEIVSELVTYDQLVSTFTKVTGKKAEYKRLTIPEYFDLFESADGPIASDLPNGTTFRTSFSGAWNCFHDDLIKRDMNWIKSVHPDTLTLERWMTETKYGGDRTLLLKNVEDAKSIITPSMKHIIAL